MKLAIQIISQNQAEHLSLLKKELKNLQSDIFWGLDRCTDNSLKLLQSLNEKNIVVNSEGKGFLAGKMRDMVLDEILKYDYDTILMLDGDRHPNNLSKKEIEKYMNIHDLACMLSNDPIKLDTRIINYKARPGTSSNTYWSCVTAGLVVKRIFVEKVRKLKIMEGRCFHKAFDGIWGCEDTLFGACLYVLGARIGYMDATISGSLNYEGRKCTKEEKNIIKIRENLMKKLLIL
jgi:hypothetical protein